MLAPVVFASIVRGGLGEETFYRGYLSERLGKLLRPGVGAKVAVGLLTTAFFASLHYSDQGLAGVEQATITGLVFGATFARTVRIWPITFAHAAFDLTAVAIIYSDLETTVAHLLIQPGRPAARPRS